MPTGLPPRLITDLEVNVSLVQGPRLLRAASPLPGALTEVGSKAFMIRIRDSQDRYPRGITLARRASDAVERADAGDMLLSATKP